MRSIRAHIRDIVDAPFAQVKAPGEVGPPQHAIKGRYKSFGPANPDKVFYVIWRNAGSFGFFSNLSFVVGHLSLALQNDLVPVIDFENFPTVYNEEEEIEGSRNSWDYYFCGPSQYKLSEVYQSSHVLFCSGSWPEGVHLNLLKESRLFDVFDQHVRFNHNVSSLIEKYTSILTQRTLGVHFRGREQNQAPAHWFGPTLKQMIACIDRILNERDIDRVFLVTEHHGYLDELSARYGNKLVSLESYRSRNGNAYNESPRPRHRYSLGLEILVEGVLLSRCAGLLCGSSNVAEFARFYNHGRYEFVYRIHNGQNSRNPLAALYLFDVRRRLPASAGGLKNILEIVEGGESRLEGC
jgi:hypothetical protein